MSIKDIAHSVVRKYPGGIRAMAARMEMSENVLKNKLNPNIDSHHLNIAELELIIDLADTDKVAQYFCSQRNGYFVKSHQIEHVSDMALLDLFLEREERYGKFAKSVRKALADGGIDAEEFKELMSLFDEVSETREQIKARIKTIYQQTLEREQRLKVQVVK